MSPFCGSFDEDGRLRGVRGGNCGCKITDWRALRLALGLTQAQLAALLALSIRHVKRYESPGHHCPHGSTVLLLRAHLQRPELQERLRLAGVAHPFPEDLAD